MKKLNKTGPSTDPWGTPLVTSLQLDSAPLMKTKNYVALTASKQGRHEDGREGLDKRLMKGVRGSTLQASSMDWQASTASLSPKRGDLLRIL